MPPTQQSDKRKAAAPRAAHPLVRSPSAKPRPVVAGQAPAQPWDPRAPVFSEAVFGARLALALDALLAMQRAEAAQIARGPRGPRAAIFMTSTSLSRFEADRLTLHFLCGGVSLAALVVHHRGALPHVAAALDGLEIADLRALLWERAAMP